MVRASSTGDCAAPAYNHPATAFKGVSLAERYFQHTFPNGLTLLGEQMPGMQSVAMTFLVAAGACGDPVDRSGSTTVLSDLVLRGAGARDSRALTDYLDTLGLQRSSSVGVFHTRFGAAALGPKVMEGLSAYADIVRRPQLPEAGFESGRDLALQALEGIDDDPRQKLMIKLREWHFPSPYGRNPMGTKDDLEKLTLELVKADHARRYHARDAILSLAGNIDFDEIRSAAEKLFGDWSGADSQPVEIMPPPGRFHHEDQESEQTHIGIAWPSVPETDPDYYTVRMATEVLSGGMSGRLFTEVREKRGLCYSVWAGYSGLKAQGSIFGYAGTSNERAQATLDCFVEQLHRMEEGVTKAELDRAKTGLKASTIMQGESTSARAGAIAHDFFMRGRIRTLEEIKAGIDAVTVDRVNGYLKEHPAGPFTIVTVGPKALNLP
ncbi:MAG TPA: pitrilysin family protein [Tepidisphaeraceae bacterium]|jgi:predicted Zn-dependent peptidase|nr:pitrilysin family protein [Tepidisphaeraceae bacterium]